MPFSDVSRPLVLDELVQAAMAFRALLRFAVRRCRPLVLVVASVTHLCILRALHGLDHNGQVCVRCARFAALAGVGFRYNGQSVRQLHVGVGVQESCHSGMCAVDVLLVARAMQTTQQIAPTATGHSPGLHQTLAQNDWLLHEALVRKTGLVLL